MDKKDIVAHQEAVARQQALARREWVSACHFHDLSEAEVLKEVASRVATVRAECNRSHEVPHPLVLLDLDSTLYDVEHRTFRIIQEWVETPQSQAYPNVRTALNAMCFHHLAYSIRDIFGVLGLSFEDPEVQAAHAELSRFWFDRFFTNQYLAYDKPYPGAAHFTREIHELGAEIVYLTGRDEPGMGEGTRANLLRDGFPWNVERTHLLLKPNFEMPDLEHKTNAGEYIRTHGKLVASFENEPLNIVGLYRLFPDAMHVFIDTGCSETPATPLQGLYRIEGFAAE